MIIYTQPARVRRAIGGSNRCELRTGTLAARAARSAYMAMRRGGLDVSTARYYVVDMLLGSARFVGTASGLDLQIGVLL